MNWKTSPKGGNVSTALRVVLMLKYNWNNMQTLQKKYDAVWPNSFLQIK